MKTWIRRILALLLVTLVMSACKWTGSNDYSPYQHICLEEVAYLIPEVDESPYCDFSIDYSCLHSGNDSIQALINQAVQRELLGEAYASLSTEEAVDSFKNDYLRQYMQEVGGMLLSEQAKDAPTESMPAWYNRTYSFVTFMEEGYGETIIATGSYYEDMGAAHPNQWSRWLNFDANTGKMLTIDDVFKAETRAEVEQMLLVKLIEHQAALYPEETIGTLEDLHEKGFLNYTPIYIPDNFLLSEDKLHFIFNRYDIAPYAAGEIVLEASYEEIGHCLLVK